MSTPEISEYAQRRLSDRMLGAILPPVMVCGLAASILIATHMAWWAMVLAALAFVYLVVMVISWVRPVHPTELTAVRWPTSGTWQASMQASLFPEALVRRPDLRDAIAVRGRVHLDESGLTFEPDHKAVHDFGIKTHVWPATGALYARRLRGFGGQTHLTIIAVDQRAKAADVWIWGGPAFPFSLI